MSAYYNEIDPRAAAWLRELIAQGHIAPGIVDERSIKDIRATDLAGYTQCHFFAGIGVWSAALRAAGWSDDRPVWTGSCPCQPFSTAGRGDGFDDARHLWPEFYRLIAERRPPVVFGEQVASKDGLQWLDLVHADMEASGYAVGAVDLSAAGIGAPHIRQRLYWVADASSDRVGQYTRELHGDEGQHEDRTAYRDHASIARGSAHIMGIAERAGLEGHSGDGDHWHEPGRLGAIAAGSVAETGATRDLGDTSRGGCGERGDAAFAGSRGHTDSTGVVSGVDDAAGSRCERTERDTERDPRHETRVRLPGAGCEGGGLVDTNDARREGHGLQPLLVGGNREGTDAGTSGLGAAHGERPGPTNGHWRAADWLLCRDGKWRAVEPGTFPLAHGAEARVGRLRGYGNAICLPLAQTFIEAYREAKGELG